MLRLVTEDWYVLSFQSAVEIRNLSKLMVSVAIGVEQTRKSRQPKECHWESGLEGSLRYTSTLRVIGAGCMPVLFAQAEFISHLIRQNRTLKPNS